MLWWWWWKGHLPLLTLVPLRCIAVLPGPRGLKSPGFYFYWKRSKNCQKSPENGVKKLPDYTKRTKFKIASGGFNFASFYPIWRYKLPVGNTGAQTDRKTTIIHNGLLSSDLQSRMVIDCCSFLSLSVRKMVKGSSLYIVH